MKVFSYWIPKLSHSGSIKPNVVAVKASKSILLRTVDAKNRKAIGCDLGMGERDIKSVILASHHKHATINI